MTTLEGVVQAMREAGRIMLEAHAIRITEKEGHANFVTDYDVRVQRHLQAALSTLVPESRFLAEEDGAADAVLTDALTWVVDPIDGTTNFMRNRRSSAISVALLERKAPILGAIYDPYADRMCTALRGEGAWENGRRMQVSALPFSKAIVCMGTSPYKPALASATLRIAEDFLLHAADLRRSGSAAIDFCDIASGRAEIFFELQLAPWDVAAGALLVTEAGGVFATPGQAVPDFSQPRPMLAASAACFDPAMRVLRAHGEGWLDV